MQTSSKVSVSASWSSSCNHRSPRKPRNACRQPQLVTVTRKLWQIQAPRSGHHSLVYPSPCARPIALPSSGPSPPQKGRRGNARIRPHSNSLKASSARRRVCILQCHAEHCLCWLGSVWGRLVKMARAAGVLAGGVEQMVLAEPQLDCLYLQSLGQLWSLDLYQTPRPQEP